VWTQVALDRPATLDHTLPMLESLHGRWMVFFIAVCVLLLFFFPLVQGPFQATHGPTTAFRALIAFLILIFSIILSPQGILTQHNRPTALTLGDLLSRSLIASDSTAINESVVRRC
jgi:hypothetical protein